MRVILWLIVALGAVIFLPITRHLLAFWIGAERLNQLRRGFWIAMTIYFALMLWFTAWQYL